MVVLGCITNQKKYHDKIDEHVRNGPFRKRNAYGQ
jgi:hypothetical protein